MVAYHCDDVYRGIDPIQTLLCHRRPVAFRHIPARIGLFRWREMRRSYARLRERDHS
jgi:hypothetical protein